MREVENIRDYLDLERRVKVGETCWAFWTNSGGYFQAEVVVEAINWMSFRVRITKPIDQYPQGTKLNIPKFNNIKRWTWNNRLAPSKKSDRENTG